MSIHSVTRVRIFGKSQSKEISLGALGWFGFFIPFLYVYIVYIGNVLVVLELVKLCHFLKILVNTKNTVKSFLEHKNIFPDKITWPRGKLNLKHAIGSGNEESQVKGLHPFEHAIPLPTSGRYNWPETCIVTHYTGNILVHGGIGKIDRLWSNPLPPSGKVQNSRGHRLPRKRYTVNPSWRNPMP